MNDFSNLTLIIATYGSRHDFVLRACQLWKETGVYIIIVDGSDNAMPKTYQQELSKTTSYFHFASVDYFKRLRTATELIKTDYVIMHPDDDIMFQEVIKKCIVELNRDSKLLACEGVYSWFTFFQKKMYSLKGIAVVKQLSPPDDNASQRLWESFDSVFLYGVWRTHTLRTCFKMFPEKVSSPAVFCMVFQCGLAYLGKWKTLRELMWLRSYEDVPSSERDGIKRSFYFHQWYETDVYRAEVEETLERMVSVIVAETNCAPETVKKDLLKVFDHNSNLSKQEFGEEISGRTTIPLWRRLLQNFLPRSVIRAYRRFRYRNTPPAGVLFGEQISWLREYSIEVDDKNIKWLEKVLCDYYTKK